MNKQLSPMEGTVILNDLELNHEEFSTVCYHQTGIRLIDERNTVNALMEFRPPQELITLFYNRLSSINVIVKNITTSDKKNKYDNPLIYLKYFRDFGINVTILNKSEFDTIRKVSPPLHDFLKATELLTSSSKVVTTEEVWVSEKPEADKPFLLATATRINEEWDYSFWQVMAVSTEDGWYYGLHDAYGEEWGPYEDLHAEFYKVISPKN